uniref:Uncharacterized protein n=1 Tax=Anguilla anguilla TaxID=7936 RepID=A0A0E9SYE4_ANGAN
MYVTQKKLSQAHSKLLSVRKASHSATVQFLKIQSSVQQRVLLPDSQP